MITTALTEMFGLLHPIVLAPMGSISGGELAASVSNAGALGLVGGGYGDHGWLRTELGRVQEHAKRPWGVGLITWAIDQQTVDLALTYRPAAFMLAFGDPRPYARSIKAAGCKLICQTQDVDDARVAKEAGADVIVAQGAEAGGHGRTRATLPLVPAVVDAVAPTPVLAAGGIADGRGLAAALMLGAEGVLMGTRFCASVEALGQEASKQRLIAARGDETARTRVFDTVRGLAWPGEYTGRALRNRFMDTWADREGDLIVALVTERDRYRAAVRQADYDTAVIWASEAVDLINSVESAGTLVGRISEDAEAQIARAAKLLTSKHHDTE
jgi:nitronate monooxygenase